MTNAIGRRRLHELATQLSDRDLAILTGLADYRLLTSHQIRRLHFTSHANQSAATRATNNALHQLASDTLIRTLNRRVGGLGGGSHVQLWHLTPAGSRLLAERETAADRYRRAWPTGEVGTRFINHTLATAEIAVRLRETAHNHQLDLVDLKPEPACWQRYLTGHAIHRLLKPDLFSITAAAGSSYEQLWFIEVDMATESLATIEHKIATYTDYQRTGKATQDHGTMPRVAWITPNPDRTHTLQKHANHITAGRNNIHHAMTLQQFIQTVTETEQQTAKPP